MTNLRLSKRLKAISDFVDDGEIIMDVGCDHALLDIYLEKTGRIKKAIASDVNQNALNQALKNTKFYKTKKIELRLSDGLDALRKEDNVTQIVISGLGDKKITEVLSKNLDKLKNVKTIIIQPNTNPWKVRLYLSKQGYMVKDEVLVEEKDIIYTIIKFIKKRKKYRKKQLYFGPVLLKNKDVTFNKNLSNMINNNKVILSKLPRKKMIKRLSLKLLNKVLKKEMK